MLEPSRFCPRTSTVSNVKVFLRDAPQLYFASALTIHSSGRARGRPAPPLVDSFRSILQTSRCERPPCVMRPRVRSGLATSLTSSDGNAQRDHYCFIRSSMTLIDGWLTLFDAHRPNLSRFAVSTSGVAVQRVERDLPPRFLSRVRPP